MAFSELINRLVPEGSVMAGNRPKVILADDSGGGSEPGYFDISKWGNLLRGVERFQAGIKAKAEEETKKQKSRMDMYKTLRDAGYDPKRAYDAVLDSKFPVGPGGETTEEKETEAKIKESEAKIEYYKKRGEKLETKPEQKLRERIIEKVASGEELTPGEQKVYDEIYRKYGKKSDLEAVLGEKINKIDSGGKEEYVPMKDPLGNKKLVPKKNVEKAKARGWKLR